MTSTPSPGVPLLNCASLSYHDPKTLPTPCQLLSIGVSYLEGNIYPVGVKGSEEGKGPLFREFGLFDVTALATNLDQVFFCFLAVEDHAGVGADAAPMLTLLITEWDNMIERQLLWIGFSTVYTLPTQLLEELHSRLAAPNFHVLRHCFYYLMDTLGLFAGR